MLTQANHRQILPDHPQRPTTAVVFVAVRGTTTIRSTSGALIVAGTSQMAGSTTSAFVFPQDRVKILLSGAAFSGPFSGSAGWQLRVVVYRRFRRRVACVSVRMNRKAAFGGPERTTTQDHL
jgi:hypothetical protein